MSWFCFRAKSFDPSSAFLARCRFWFGNFLSSHRLSHKCFFGSLAKAWSYLGGAPDAVTPKSIGLWELGLELTPAAGPCYAVDGDEDVVEMDDAANGRVRAEGDACMLPACAVAWNGRLPVEAELWSFMCESIASGEEIPRRPSSCARKPG